MYKCLGEKFSGKKRLALGKGLLVAFERNLSKRALNLSENDLYAVVNGSEEEKEGRGLEIIESGNWERSTLF